MRMVRAATLRCSTRPASTAQPCKAAGACRIASVHPKGCRWTTRSENYKRSLILTRAEDGPLGSSKLGQIVDDQYDFDEGAAQVQRLLQRDRKELTGIEEIGASLSTEFDEENEETEQQKDNKASTSGRAASPFVAGSSKASSPFGKPAGAANPFGTRASNAPFSGAGNAKLFKEMEDMSPYMQPDALDDQPWWKSISLGQVLIVLSFVLIISLMLGTFTLVLKVGGIHFNE